MIGDSPKGISASTESASGDDAGDDAGESEEEDCKGSGVGGGGVREGRGRTSLR